MAPTRNEFAELIAKAREGDLEARKKLFDLVADEDALGADLLLAARKILPSRDRGRKLLDSQDLLQTALRVGWVDAASFEGATLDEFLAWLRTILRRKLLKALRRKRPDVGLDPAQEADGRRPGRATQRGPLDEVLAEEVKARVRKALTLLPPDQQAVVVLRLSGLDSPRIAEKLGIGADAVRKRESRAARRLREILEEYGGERET
jgi:RNA polymerase sigma-70 factor (ECF subfamily)